jgi:hypothetical protein
LGQIQLNEFLCSARRVLLQNNIFHSHKAEAFIYFKGPKNCLPLCRCGNHAYGNIFYLPVDAVVVVLGSESAVAAGVVVRLVLVVEGGGVIETGFIFLQM